jgi:succinate-semialdehyde dehydrogenase/glutarate-semialdehyde dehydrogenase
MVTLSNLSRYGLGSSVWSTDTDRALALGAQLENGLVFVNDFTRSDPAVPFGGVKASGYGRELGQQGILEFVNTQTTWVA